jgi:hypothetical protein
VVVVVAAVVEVIIIIIIIIIIAVVIECQAEVREVTVSQSTLQSPPLPKKYLIIQ